MNQLSSNIIGRLAEVLGRTVEVGPLGEFVEVGPAEAYEFACITGATYLDNFSFPFTPRPFTKIFGAALDLTMTSGMYDRGVPKFTPSQLAARYPFISHGKKYIFVSTHSTVAELLENRQKYFDMENDAHHCVLLEVESSKRGNGLEGLIEYLAMMQFKKQGFVVENQSPLSASLGSPDVVAVKLPGTRRTVLELMNIDIASSLYLLSARAIFAGGQASTASNGVVGQPFALVGEAKTANASGDKQLQKYMDSNFFSRSIFMSESKSPRSTTADFEICLKDFSEEIEFPTFKDPAEPITSDGRSYLRWFEVVVLCTIFSSLKIEAQSSFAQKFTSSGKIAEVPQFISQCDTIGATERIRDFF